ncbi:dTDP-4-dehydrorhamnose reductase [Salegentibacter chungangensis]|uniref:dTDP-4-dehydrorhamnose reductase n=1 Tax=Salegentibacter chungangensis TaxID=1335724 RepID=A0ABW3NNP1_9FLAO
MKTVLVTGGKGQLAQCFEKLSKHYPDLDLLIMSSEEVDITNKSALRQLFEAKKIDFCINCAAYTNVEKAEEEKEKAFLVNAKAARNLAALCKVNDIVLIHFSTDYVFDGNSNTPYSEEDQTNPINIYGSSKLKGEEYIKQECNNYFIFRTSWLYSEFGHNFFNTILRKAEERTDLKITTSQTGTPTNANDLAEMVLDIIDEDDTDFGLYHYSNEGEATWYDFALAILELSGKRDQVSLTKSNAYKTVAERPVYSVLNKKKFKNTFQLEVPHWKDSLKELIDSLDS